MVEEILGDGAYAKRASKLGELLVDNAIHPLDKAVFYVEYIMRHNGASHLRYVAHT